MSQNPRAINHSARNLAAAIPNIHHVCIRVGCAGDCVALQQWDRLHVVLLWARRGDLTLKVVFKKQGRTQMPEDKGSVLGLSLLWVHSLCLHPVLFPSDGCQ